MRRRKRQPWYTDMRARLRFEGGARSHYPSLGTTTTGRGYSAVVTYRLIVDVPQYETHRVTIRLRNGIEPYEARISVDGPIDSPHRYGKHRLCLWHPDDAPDQRWLPADGLLDLISQVRIHLFKEAYWRETGEWIGPEAPHSPLASDERPDA